MGPLRQTRQLLRVVRLEGDVDAAVPLGHDCKVHARTHDVYRAAINAIVPSEQRPEHCCREAAARGRVTTHSPADGAKDEEPRHVCGTLRKGAGAQSLAGKDPEEKMYVFVHDLYA